MDARREEGALLKQCNRRATTQTVEDGPPLKGLAAFGLRFRHSSLTCLQACALLVSHLAPKAAQPNGHIIPL